MRIGTIVRLPDGREGTVVYHGLDGYGIKWGRHQPALRDFEGTAGNLLPPDPEKNWEDWPWFADAMLRDEYPGADLPCVGEDYELVHVPEE